MPQTAHHVDMVARMSFAEWPMKACLLALMVITLAWPAQAEWEENLAAQLRWDHNCKVNFYSGVIERLIEGNLVVIAKAHCDDGRLFDAIQRNELEEFEISECTPVEQAC
jgi:hypothetical protein